MTRSPLSLRSIFGASQAIYLDLYLLLLRSASSRRLHKCGGVSPPTLTSSIFSSPRCVRRLALGLICGGSPFHVFGAPSVTESLSSARSSIPRLKGQAKPGQLYTLMMLDFDGDALGSWPDKVPPGKNSPVRHWIVGNIPGELLSGRGLFGSSASAADRGRLGRSAGRRKRGRRRFGSARWPNCRARPCILIFRLSLTAIVSTFFSKRNIYNQNAVSDPITNFDYRASSVRYHLCDPIASNWFVAVYTSEQPFSGKAFHGNDVSATWRQDLEKGDLGRER